MERLDHLQPGDILKQADLATYIVAMGLGVAEAQRVLDDNSVKQLGEFVKPQDGLAGKSLIQLGLMPAFYHFRSATLSCSVSMTLQVREEIDVELKVGAGAGSSSATTLKQGSKSITSKSQKVVVSSRKTISASATSSAMAAIDSYAAQNTKNGEYFALGERSQVSSTISAGFAAQGLVRYSQAAALFVVPPAGMRWAVFQVAVPSASTDTFQIKPGSDYTPGVLAAKPLAEGILAHALSGGSVTGYILSAEPLSSKVLFKTNSYLVQKVDGVDYTARLRAVAHMIVTAGLSGIELVGHADGMGSTDYNQRLSELRAKAVLDVLTANGVSIQVSLSAVGEQGAQDNTASAAARSVTIKLGSGFTRYLVFLQEKSVGGLSPNMGPSATTDAVNGVRDSGLYDPSGTAVSGGASVTTALELSASLNSSGNVEASRIEELVYLTNKETTEIAKVTVYARDGSSFASDESSTFDDTVESSTSNTEDESSDSTVNRASAVAFSLDARYSRMFDLTMSGNMSLAAEMVSIPAPPEFLQFIKDYLE